MSDKTTRDHIVEAADQLFYRQGYEHTSFADIADAVHISRGNFYYHFKTKDEILDAVINVAAELKRRAKAWKPPKPRYKRGVLAKYARLVSSASLGAVTDLPQD